MRSIRTLAKIDFECVVFTSEMFQYQAIAAKVKKFRWLGMNYSQVARALGVDEKTVKKAPWKI